MEERWNINENWNEVLSEIYCMPDLAIQSLLMSHTNNSIILRDLKRLKHVLKG